jgi:glycerol uptake facilitator-like aquaporin
MFLTAVLVFAVLMLAAEKHYGTFLAPVGIGLTLFIAELSGRSSLYTRFRAADHVQASTSQAAVSIQQGRLDQMWPLHHFRATITSIGSDP